MMNSPAPFTVQRTLTLAGTADACSPTSDLLDHMPPKRNKFNIDGEPSVKASRLSQSARYRILIDRAEKELEAKVLELQEAAAMRDNLLGRLCMLEDLTSDAGNIAALQRITTRLTTINRAPPLPESLSMSSYSIDIDSLPSSGLDSYSDELLVRISRMSIGDAVNVYRGFLSRSFESENQGIEFDQVYSQFLNFSAIWAMNPTQRNLFTMNLETGREEEPSSDWYRAHSLLIPANGQYADLCTNLMSYMAHLSQTPGQRPLTTIQEVAAAVNSFAGSSNPSFTIDPENKESIKRQVEIDAVLNRFERISRSMISLRTLMTLYMSSQMILILGSEVCASFGRSVWPFAMPRGMKVVEFYLRRPDVQSALSDFRASRLISTTLASLQGGNAVMPQPESGIQIQQDSAFNPFAATRIEEEKLNPQAENAVNPESLDLLFSLTRSSSNEVSKNSSGSDRLKAENSVANPVESMLNLLASNEDGLSANGAALSPIRLHPLSEPINLGMGPDDSLGPRHQSLMVQSILPLEDMLLMASDQAWGS